MPTKPIPQYPLGKNGPSVPALGFGLMGLSHSYGSYGTDEERFKILDRALELGSTFWDSADLYQDGEELLGKWFQRTGKRDQIFLATKFGYVKGSKTLEVDNSAAYCKKACAESLKVLGVDYIDLYYLHNANPDTPIEETMRAMAELQAEGKIKHIGLSTVSSTTLLRASKIAPVAAVQTGYSPFDLDIEGPAGTDLLATCRALGVAIVILTPLSRGLLTSTFGSGQPLSFDPADSRPRALPRFQGDAKDHNTQVVAKFQSLAEKKGCTVAQLALAWLLKQGTDIFPIPGTKQIRYLEENWNALDIELSDEEEREIRAFGSENQLEGGQVPKAFEGYIYRDTKEEGS